MTNKEQAIRLTEIFYENKDSCDNKDAIISKKNIYETYCYFLRKLEGKDE